MMGRAKVRRWKLGGRREISSMQYNVANEEGINIISNRVLFLSRERARPLSAARRVERVSA